jgi:beta-glucosidase
VVFEQRQGPQFGDPFLRLGILKEGTAVDPLAKELAAKADAVVVGVGFAPETETEGADREFRLPPGQDELIREIAAANKNTIVAVTSGGSVDTSSWIDKISGLLEVWYPGQEGGTAAAEAILGEINPSGHLPISWERKLDENPSIRNYYYDQPGSPKITYKEGIFVGYRGYEHNQVKPLFPFGYGLSYTKFKYSTLSIRPLDETQAKYEVSFDVTNEGHRSGTAVAQLYVHDGHSKVPRPEKELKGFARVVLDPGQKQHVTVPLEGRAFTYYDVSTKQWHADPGSFEISVGSSSAQTELHDQIKVATPIDIPVDR